MLYFIPNRIYDFFEDCRDEKMDADTSPDNCDKTQPHICASPNQLLFKLFIDHLKDVHDREIQLTDFECEQLVSLIEQRERDLEQHPLPFTPRQSMQHKNMSNIDVEHCSESILSLATSLSGSVAQSLMTMSTIASQSQATGSQRLTSAASMAPPRGTTPTANECDNESVKVTPLEGGKAQRTRTMDHLQRSVPRWRCFVRSLTNTHIMLCFVPTSFNDLLTLTYTSEGQESKRPSVSSHHSSGVTRLSSQAEPIRHPSDSQSKAKQNEEQTDELVMTDELVTDDKMTEGTLFEGNADSPSKETDQVTPEEEIVREQEDLASVSITGDVGSVHDLVATEFSPDTHPEVAQNLDAPKSSTSVVLPCYIYNCPLSFLSEQLINKWTFQCPSDIYEDLTFKVDEARDLSTEQKNEEESMSQRPRRISELDLGKNEDQNQDVYQNVKELKQHCTMVSETFLRCFVKGKVCVIVLPSS